MLIWEERERQRKKLRSRTSLDLKTNSSENMSLLLEICVPIFGSLRVPKLEITLERALHLSSLTLEWTSVHRYRLLGLDVLLFKPESPTILPNKVKTQSTILQHKIAFFRNIIQIHNSVMWDWQSSAEYYSHSVWTWGIYHIILSSPTEHCYVSE